MTGLKRFVEDEQRGGRPDVEQRGGRPDVEQRGGRPDVLRRLVGPREPVRAGEACEFCATPVVDDHRHVVDHQRQSLQCACRACALLFTGPGAGEGRYRTVPERYLRLDPFALEPAQWNALQIPVGMAFLMRSTTAGHTVAFYPSPGGATESELPLDVWDDIVAANPTLAELEPDVEAALIRSERRSPGAGEPRCYVVPIDRCYELVGELRMNWRGFDGGQDVRERIDAFFADLDRRARTVGAVS